MAGKYKLVVRGKFAVALPFVLVAVLSLWFAAPGAVLAIVTPMPSNGAAIFQPYCSGCHGPNGDATSPAAKHLNLRNLKSPEVQQKSSAELARIIAKGSKNMPAFQKSLGDEKIRALVLFLRQPVPKN